MRYTSKYNIRICEELLDFYGNQRVSTTSKLLGIMLDIDYDSINRHRNLKRMYDI